MVELTENCRGLEKRSVVPWERNESVALAGNGIACNKFVQGRGNE